MADPTYVFEAVIERGAGAVRTVHMPAEANPVRFGVHGAIAKHYGLDPAAVKEPHATTIDYVIAATAG